MFNASKKHTVRQASIPVPMLAPTTSTQTATIASQTATKATKSGTSSATPISSTTTTITRAATRTTETGTSSATSFATSSTTATTESVLTAMNVLVSPVLVVESEEGFSAGDAVVITGSGNSETRDIRKSGFIVPIASLDYDGYPAGSSSIKIGGSCSSNALSLEEHQESDGLVAVLASVAIVLLDASCWAWAAR
ncbi:unnamed protein product [Prorocentrum cordatum]|uniref:Subtilisin n=1 Tax=Prorocentrum cordatum TaxID=2364126 RepID=A0ABN9SFG0_9DINO|nr:unnamed protein product [Polarella glacialis]